MKRAGVAWRVPFLRQPLFYRKIFTTLFLNDSKQISEKKRLLLRPIIEKEAIAFGVARVMPKTIDKINILQASFRAMHLAIAKLSEEPQLLLIDGNRFKPYKKMPHNCIIGGDSKYASIAAASVLAKTYRDDYMLRLSKKFPEYGWEQNKGYGTAAHREAVKRLGPCQHHRLSFNM